MDTFSLHPFSNNPNPNIMNTPFMNTYAEMRKYENYAKEAAKQYESIHNPAWLHLQRSFDIEVRRLKSILDSHVEIPHSGKEAANV